MVKDRILIFENLTKNMSDTLKSQTSNKLKGSSVKKGIVSDIKQQFEVFSATSGEVPNSKVQNTKRFFEIRRPQKKKGFTKVASFSEIEDRNEASVKYRRAESCRENGKKLEKEAEKISQLVCEFGENLRKRLRNSSSFSQIDDLKKAKNVKKEVTETDKNLETVKLTNSENDKVKKMAEIKRKKTDKLEAEVKKMNKNFETMKLTNSEDDKIKKIEEIENFRKQIDETMNNLKDFLDDEVDSPTLKRNHDTNNYKIDDDEFGLLSLDGNCDDNYIIEAYNDEGNELVITILHINRKSVKLDENAQFNYNKNMKDLINDSDIVFHRDDTNSSLEIIKNIDSGVDQAYKIFNSNRSQSSAANTDDSGIEKDAELRNTRTSSSYSTESLSFNENNSCDDDFSACRQAYLLDSSYDKTKCHTVVDNDGNVRIRKVCSIKNDDEEIQHLVNETEHMLKSKLSYIIEELKATEKQYLNGLHKVVYDYKPYIEKNCPNHLVGKTPYIFGNIVQIYEGGKHFLDLLKGAGEDTNKLANAFIDSVSTLQLFPKYSKNKPTSDGYIKEFEQIIKKRQTELGDRLDLASYLLTPIQRLGKYILMLENIRKELKEKNMPTTQVNKALEIIRKEMKMGNDSIAIDSIKNCPIDLLTQGSFIMREKFNLIKPKKLEAMLFLFENIVVFTYNSTKYLEEFNYFDSIEMTDLSIASFETEALIFHLSDYPKCKRGQTDRYTFVLEAKSPKIKHLWTENIEKRLWEQLEKCRQQLKVDHDIQGKRLSTVDLPKRKKKKHSLKTRSLITSTTKFYDNC